MQKEILPNQAQDLGVLMSDWRWDYIKACAQVHVTKCENRPSLLWTVLIAMLAAYYGVRVDECALVRSKAVWTCGWVGVCTSYGVQYLASNKHACTTLAKIICQACCVAVSRRCHGNHFLNAYSGVIRSQVRHLLRSTSMYDRLHSKCIYVSTHSIQ